MVYPVTERMIGRPDASQEHGRELVATVAASVAASVTEDAGRLRADAGRRRRRRYGWFASQSAKLMSKSKSPFAAFISTGEPNS